MSILQKIIREKFEDIQPGDIAFFKNTDNKIVHVGIIHPDFQILHASGRVRMDKLNERGILVMETNIITHEFSHSRRILN